MSNQQPPLTRLSGLETEHAIHFFGANIPRFRFWSNNKTHKVIYRELAQHLTDNIPSAPTNSEKIGVFLANGSAIWFERIAYRNEPGLFETCTPECRGPRNVLACSRAMNRLLIEATKHRDGSFPEKARLLKNCVDPRGTHYGAQENYEVQGHEPRDYWHLKILILFTVAILCLLPLVLFLLPIFIVSLAVGLIVSVVAEARGANTQTVKSIRSYAGCPVGDDDEATMPHWTDSFLRVLVSSMLCPLALGVSLTCRFSRMGRTYTRLSPFLVSRIVFAGAGGINRKGRFQLGQKAASRDRDWFVMFADVDRPIFCFNHLIKSILPGKHLLRRAKHSRQRMSLSIGDSNMCQQSEYLRVATTTLVLDAIESGFITDQPRLSTLRALRKFNFDPTLTKSVRTSRGSMTAIEIQQFYLNACRRYIDSLDNAPAEAHEILRLWNDVLRRLHSDPESLFGRIDWITKRALMRETAEKCGERSQAKQGTSQEFESVANRAALQKVDIKYHELSDEGYYFQLESAGMTSQLLEESEIERAMRLPPQSNPAAIRSRYIREFGAAAIDWIQWDAVKLKDRADTIYFEDEMLAARELDEMAKIPS